MFKPLTQNIQAECLVWCFDPRIIPGTSHKLKSFWAGSFRVMKIIAQTLAEIKLVYYPVVAQGERKQLKKDNIRLEKHKH